MLIFKQFTFDAAHFLPNVHDGHKCKTMHGHTYRLVVYVEGKPDENLGWVMDFSDLKSVVAPIVAVLDHKVINDIKGLENPTCEHIAIWIWDKVKEKLPNLSKVELYETPTSGAVYEGR